MPHQCHTDHPPMMVLGEISRGCSGERSTVAVVPAGTAPCSVATLAFDVVALLELFFGQPSLRAPSHKNAIGSTNTC